jgi:hypothetical protein
MIFSGDTTRLADCQTLGLAATGTEFGVRRGIPGVGDHARLCDAFKGYGISLKPECKTSTARTSDSPARRCCCHPAGNNDTSTFQFFFDDTHSSSISHPKQSVPFKAEIPRDLPVIPRNRDHFP